MKDVPLIHTCWLKPFADFFATREVSLEPYCERAGIEPKQVTTGDGWITKRQLYVFLDALAKGEKMPEVGFVVGEIITPDCLGALGEAMAGQKTLGGVIRIFGQLINRHVEGNHCWVEEGKGGEVWLLNEKSPSSEPGRVVADQAGLMSMINLVRLVAGRDWYPDKAWLQTGPTQAHRKIAGFKGCNFEFDQKASGYAFQAKWLLEPIENTSATQITERRGLGLIEEGESLPRKLELVLTEMIGVGGMLPSAAMLAELIGMSLRTFHRSLSVESVTYQKILDQVRLSQAIKFLVETDMPVKEIAGQVGFSGANNFIRTFKRLQGTTPGDYRQSRRAASANSSPP